MSLREKILIKGSQSEPITERRGLSKNYIKNKETPVPTFLMEPAFLCLRGVHSHAAYAFLTQILSEPFSHENTP